MATEKITTLDQYEYFLQSAERRFCKENQEFYGKKEIQDIDSYREGYKRGIFDFFQQLRFYDVKFADFPKIIRDLGEIEQIRKENNIEIKEDDNYPLTGLLVYRDEYIPVYDDDYGQQDFIIYRGQEIGGGCYNSHPEDVFCHEIDLIKDNIK